MELALFRCKLGRSLGMFRFNCYLCDTYVHARCVVPFSDDFRKESNEKRKIIQHLTSLIFKKIEDQHGPRKEYFISHLGLTDKEPAMENGAIFADFMFASDESPFFQLNPLNLCTFTNNFEVFQGSCLDKM